jgi:PTS system nitrogen regulatory IIA component
MRSLGAELVAPERIIPALAASSKRQLLEELAARAGALVGRHEREIFDVLLQRERLGTTAVGRGVAVPHARLAGLDRVFGLFARCAPPVAFDAPDGAPVDLVFLLLAPEGAGADHLEALARVSRLLRDEGLCRKLRGARDAAALYALLAAAVANSGTA